MENGTRDHDPARYPRKYRRRGVALGKLARGSHQQTFLPTAPWMCLYEQVKPCSRSCRIHTHLEGEKGRADTYWECKSSSLPAAIRYPPFQIGGKVFCMLPAYLARPRLNQSHRHRDRAERERESGLAFPVTAPPPLRYKLLPPSPPLPSFQVYGNLEE